VRAGYPYGAPRHGHIALVALCGGDFLEAGDDVPPVVLWVR
jgi:hypothetical protein